MKKVDFKYATDAYKIISKYTHINCTMIKWALSLKKF